MTHRVARTIKNLVSASLLAAFSLVLGGCTTFTGDIRQVPHDVPEQAIYSYDSANRCVGQYAADYLESRQQNMVLAFDNIGDITRNPNDISTGPVANSGTTAISAMVKTYVPGRRVKVPLSTPQPIRLFFAVGLPVERRDLERMQREYDANIIVGVSGGVISYDDSRLGDGLGLAGSARIGEVESSARFGRTAEGGRMSMVLNFGQFRPNELVGSVGLSSSVRRNSQEVDLTVQVSGVGLGFSKSDIVADGVHNAQQNLLAAAFFYMWAMLIPGDAELECLRSPATSPADFVARMDDYENASRSGKARLLQDALNDYLGAGRSTLTVDGMLGPQTWSAIRAVEARLRLPPHSKGTLGSLYAHLVRSLAGRPRSGREG